MPCTSFGRGTVCMESGWGWKEYKTIGCSRVKRVSGCQTDDQIGETG